MNDQDYQSQISKLKEKLAYITHERDALLEMTWLDLPTEPVESTALWRKLFEEGWMRRPLAALTAPSED